MPQDSPPQYRVLVEKDVPMTTRDGVTLRADVYRPDAPGRFPVLLSRLPYNKNLRPRPGDIDYFVERGYVVIMQGHARAFFVRRGGILRFHLGNGGWIRCG
jgi:predicted acyl esterase